MNNWASVIENTAALLGLSVRHCVTGATYSCWSVAGGAALGGYEMAGQLRLMQGSAIGVVAFGWLDYKDACSAQGIPWQSCVMLSNPDQLQRCGQVLLGKDAHKRQDWREWARKLPRDRANTITLLARTASRDLSVPMLAEICGTSAATARRYVKSYNLPHKGTK